MKRYPEICAAINRFDDDGKKFTQESGDIRATLAKLHQRQKDVRERIRAINCNDTRLPGTRAAQALETRKRLLETMKRHLVDEGMGENLGKSLVRVEESNTIKDLRRELEWTQGKLEITEKERDQAITKFNNMNTQCSRLEMQLEIAKTKVGTDETPYMTEWAANWRDDGERTPILSEIGERNCRSLCTRRGTRGSLYRQRDKGITSLQQIPPSNSKTLSSQFFP